MTRWLGSNSKLRTLPLRYVAALFLLTFLQALPAAAQSFDTLPKGDQKKFRSLLDKCIAEYDRGRHEKAEALCQQAAELTPHPATRYVIARIRDREGACETAVGLYDEVLNSPPAGQSEARWVEEYRADLESHLAALGDCSARLEVKCAEADHGALVTIAGGAVGSCPGQLAAKPGAVEVVLSAPGMQSATRAVTVHAGRPPVVEFGALKKRDEPTGPGTVKVTCAAFPDGAVVTLGGSVLGVCPLTVTLPAGRQRLVALAADGARGAVSVQVDPASAQQPAEVVRFRAVQVSCADPDVRVQLKHELLDGGIDDTCGALSGDGGLLLPEGQHVVRLSKDLRQPRELVLEVGDSGSLSVVSLEAMPVPFTVSCADVAGPPVFVRIAGRTGTCPLTGEAPEGSQALTARREGHSPVELEVTLVHGAPNAFTVPALEPMPFWTPGVITATAAGTVVLAAVAVDVAGLGALDDLKAISKGDLGVCDGVEPRSCYDDRRASVESTILWTRILYGVGIAGLAAGAGLILWEQLEAAPGGFDEDASAVSVSPVLGPTAEGGAQAGVLVRWSF